MSSNCQPINIAEPMCLTETYASGECSPRNGDMLSYGNKALMIYIGIFLVVFILALIIAFTNQSALYYTLTLPSWAPSLTSWSFILAIVLFFTAFAASKMQIGSVHKNHYYGLFFTLAILLFLFFVFFIFQMNNFRTGFWILIASAIFLLITIGSGWNTYRSSSLWLLPLLALQIVLLVETWQIISANGL